MFIIELFIYIFFAWVMYSFAKKSILYDKSGVKIDKYIWYYILFFTLISAIRWRVGVDSTAYIEIFRNGIVREDSKEFLWDWLVLLVYNYGFHFVIGTAAIAFIQIFFLTKSLQEYKFILLWLPIVLFGGRYYLDLMNGIRQMAVACIYILLSRYIVERKPIPFTIGIFLLSGLHQSAMILLPTYFLTYIPFNKIKLYNKRFICLIILITCFIIGRSPSFQNLFTYIESAISITGYEEHADFYKTILTEGETEKLSFGPIMLSFLLSSIFVIWYAPTLYETYGKRIQYFNLWYFLSFFYSCMYFLVCNTSHMMIRPFQYFELFLVIMLAMLIHIFYINNKKYKYHFYALIFLFWICTIIGVYKNSGRTVEFTTYKTFFGRIE